MAFDTNGIVLTSNDPYNIGKFIGEIEGDLFNELLLLNLFEKYQFIDYQGRSSKVPSDTESCNISYIDNSDFIQESLYDYQTTIQSSGGILSESILNPINVLKWISNLIVSLTLMFPQLLILSSPIKCDENNNKKAYPSVNKVPIYQLNETKFELIRQTLENMNTTNDCINSYQLSHIPSTNVYVVQFNKICNSTVSITNEPIPIDHLIKSSQLLKKVPTDCFQYHPEVRYNKLLIILLFHLCELYFVGI